MSLCLPFTQLGFPSRGLRRTSSPPATVVTSAKKSRRWRRRPSPEEVDIGEPVGEAQEASSEELDFLAALNSERTPLQVEREAPDKLLPQPPSPSSSRSGDGVPLRGLDVIRALQRRAAAGRKQGSGTGSGTRGQRRGARGSGSRGYEQVNVRDFSNVRPLDIKSDWGTRLDELDRLVQELLEQRHLYSD